jgi:general secretion pathway protein I
MKRRQNKKGFTLLEVLVASTIMAIAIGTLMSAITTSLRNASRIAENDRAAVIAKRVMDELVAGPALPSGEMVTRQFDPRQTGFSGGFQARMEPFEKIGNKGLDRIAMELYWFTPTGDRRTFQLEAYRPSGVPIGGPR